MGIRAFSILTILSTLPAQALEADLACSGDAFAWRLEITGDSATLSLGTNTRMDVMHEAIAEGQEWPRALTLIGDRDTAIVILEPRTCPGDPDASHTAEVLTQRGQTPILLTGCCRAVP